MTIVNIERIPGGPISIELTIHGFLHLRIGGTDLFWGVRAAGVAS